MNLSEKTLQTLLENKPPSAEEHPFYSLHQGDPGYLTAPAMAQLYISAALLITALRFLMDQLWIKNNKDNDSRVSTSFSDLISPFFSDELAPLLFLKPFIISSSDAQMEDILQDTIGIEDRVLSLMLERTGEDQRAFMVQSLKEMLQHFIHEENEQTDRSRLLGHKGLLLYRTFDNLDRIFALDYRLDTDMVVDHSTKESLYQQSGVEVQSGYSTILLALHTIHAGQGSTLIDLGSGYGRVGLVCALLRPDIDVTGYEYVPHRVDVANQASENLGLQEHLRFKAQDLSSPSFTIPDADVYYLYDPFTEETYRSVLKQILAVSRRRQITVVTKGAAGNWLMEISEEHKWPEPVCIDYGNLCIFRSKAWLS